MSKVKAGIVGTGNISGIYFENGSKFDSLEVVACADLDVARARAKAEQYNIRGCSVEEMMQDSEIELIINLTIPKAHAAVNMQALVAGKHVYVEKPFAVTREEAKQVLELAKEKGLYVGGAPDTFLGGGIQTCIKLIEDGWIGQPIGATAFMLGGGHESWHPTPEFYYEAGGGPMFDMGPYYLTALIAMLGPIKQITGTTAISYPQRMITSQPKYGQQIEVDVPTHIAGIMQFSSGAIGTILTSFDVKGGTSLPNIEVYGSQGTMLVPDPNGFGGNIRVHRAGSSEFKEVPHLFGNTENARGIGVNDMAKAILNQGQHRANGELAYHVLEAMHGFHDASDLGKHYQMTSTCERPKRLDQK
ncbi:Gfo/Idh/MocA family protein [Paenibacillus yanchengensis]|uniref:Gfo/Idh/MocA family protein n=1 Tax=Paenibacillus yanchengensis TaxID=2035833 RepID=A0ABW4YRG7_9BACL